MRWVDTNHSVMLSIVSWLDTPEFRRKFGLFKLPAKDFSMYLVKGAVSAAENNIRKMKEKISRRRNDLKE